MIQKPIIIFGSSRDKGDTWRAIQLVTQKNEAQIINLNNFNFSDFDYEFKNKNDDFHKLALQMLEHDTLVLATPVYWWTMSAIMKRFLDRWTDLLTKDKELGRKLRGKKLFIITSHTGNFKGFDSIFKQTAAYLGMHYGGCFFYHADPNKEQENIKLAAKFSKKIFR